MKTLKYILVALIFSGCTSVFFQPSKRIFPASFEKNIAPQAFSIPSFDQTPLSAWYFSAPKQPAKAIVVQFHGNAENMTTHFQSVHWLANEGFDLITFDYRGYGSSPGDPSMTEVYKDVVATIQYVDKLAIEKNLSLILIGQSLGGSLMLKALQEIHPKKLKAIVIEGSFYSYRQIAREKLDLFGVTRPLKFLSSFLISDMYSPGGQESLARLPRVPKYLLYSEQDPVVPFHHGEKIFSEMSEPKFFWPHPERGHINGFFIQNGKRKAELLRAFDQAMNSKIM